MNNEFDIELYLQGLRPYLNAIEEKMGFGAGAFSNGWLAIQPKIGHLRFKQAEELKQVAFERSIPLPSGKKTSLMEATLELSAEGLEMDENTKSVVDGLRHTFDQMDEIGFLGQGGMISMEERVQPVMERQYNPIKEFWLVALIKRQGSLDPELNQKLGQIYSDATEGKSRDQLLDFLTERVLTRVQEKLQKVPMQDKDWLTVQGYKQGLFDNNLLRYALKGDVEVLSE